MEQIDVSAVMINWNDYDDTSCILQQLSEIDFENLNTIVVDNGSSDDSANKIEAEYPETTLLRNPENIGFAGGMNRGIRESLERGSDYVWLLNTDLMIEDENILQQLVEVLQDDPSIGGITPLIRNYPNTDEIWFWKGRIDWRGGKGYTVGNPPSLEADLVANDYIPFCCALFPASIFREIGLIPETYFIYYEDVDYSSMITAEGYLLLTHMDVEIHHEQGGAAGHRLGPLSSYYDSRNRLLFCKKFDHRVGRWYPIRYAIDAVREILLRTYFRRFDGIYAFFRGVIDGVRRREGKGPYP